MTESYLNTKPSVASKKPDDHRLATCSVRGGYEDIVGERAERRFDFGKEVVGKIPEKWGKEEMLEDWIDHTSFDSCLAPKGILTARAALVAEGRRASRGAGIGLRAENNNRCLLTTVTTFE